MNGPRLTLLTAVTATILAACTFPVTPPRIELETQPSYNTHDFLVPYSVESDRTEMTITWNVERFEPAEGAWAAVREQSIVVPGVAAGLYRLELRNQGDGRYRLTAQLQTDRSPDEQAPSLSASGEFYVDTQRPDSSITLAPPGGSFAPFTAVSVTATYDGFVDTDVESPVRLYHVVDSTTFPTRDLDPTVDSIIISDGTEAAYTHVLTIVAIDDAGNVGSYRIETYRAP